MKLNDIKTHKNIQVLCKIFMQNWLWLVHHVVTAKAFECSWDSGLIPQKRFAPNEDEYS